MSVNRHLHDNIHVNMRVVMERVLLYTSAISRASAGAFSCELSSSNWALHFLSLLLPTLL